LLLHGFDGGKKVAEIFALAGIETGGRRPWDLQVCEEHFYQRLLSNGNFGVR
jgi:hypothetical protein